MNLQVRIFNFIAPSLNYIPFVVTLYYAAKTCLLEYSIILQQIRFYEKIIQLREDDILRQSILESTSYYPKRFSMVRQRGRPRLHNIFRFFTVYPAIDINSIFNSILWKSAIKEYIKFLR